MKLLFLLLFTALAALAQPATTITINQTRANGGTNGNCLKVNSNGTVGQVTGCGGGGGAGTVTSVTGTANQITVVNPTTTPVISLTTNTAIPGSPTTTTQAPGDSSTKVATTAFVTGAISTACTLGGSVVGNCGSNSINSDVSLPGNPTTTTQTAGNNSTRIATTAFVTSATGAYLPLAGGTMTGNILFTDGLFDIGATGATRPRNIYLSNTLTSLSAKLTGLAGGGTQCVTVDNTGVLGASASPCGTGNGSAQGTISGMSVAVTHASSTVLTYSCFTSGGVWLEPNTVTQTSATVLTLAFLSDQTGGTCNVFTQGSSGSGGSGVTAVNASAPITTTGGTTPTIGINNFGGDAGSGGTAGAVPAPAMGDAAAGKYLKADGTWAAISSGSTTVTQIFITSHGNHTVDAAISSEFFSSCDATAGNVTLTLPASPSTGELHNIKRKDASGNLCIISGNGKTIDGGASVPMASQYMGVSVYYDGTQWWVI